MDNEKGNEPLPSLENVQTPQTGWKQLEICPALVENRERMRLKNQLRFQVEIIVHAPLRFRAIDITRHEQIARVMVPLGLNQTGVELCQAGIGGGQFPGQDLELLAAAPFDEGATDQMIDDL